MSQLQVSRITPSIGAELSGLDFSRPLAERDHEAIYDALLEHKMICFREQTLSPEAHLDFARSFGDLEPPHPYYAHVEHHPEIMLLDFGPDNPPNTDQWHTDVTFKSQPPFASILYSRKIPPVGGDTLWANMTAAYAALPVTIKEEIKDLRAVHDLSDFANHYTKGEPDGAATKLMEAYQRYGSAIHPVVKFHPATGEPALFCNPSFTSHIVGVAKAESSRILTYLHDFMNQPEFQMRFKWTENTIVMWDNRCTMHYALGDYLPHRRTMNRITVVNDKRADARAADKVRKLA